MNGANTHKNITNANPFTVPDGYFDKLKSDILARLPEQKASPKGATGKLRQLLRPVIGIAATACVAVFGATVYTHKMNNDAAFLNRFIDDNAAEMMFASDDAADYIMLDNDDIYLYLADADCCE